MSNVSVSSEATLVLQEETTPAIIEAALINKSTETTQANEYISENN